MQEGTIRYGKGGVFSVGGKVATKHRSRMLARLGWVGETSRHRVNRHVGGVIHRGDVLTPPGALLHGPRCRPSSQPGPGELFPFPCPLLVDQLSKTGRQKYPIRLPFRAISIGTYV
jgi:hypothetical protein